MTRKKIIIDGIDISECQDFYISTVGNNKYCHCDCDNTPYLACKDNQNCYFKQLARKTQECERSRKRISDLEERIINHSNEIEEYCSRLADKNKECEELKERLERIEEDLKYQCVDCMNIKSDRYRKALEEIEEVADDYNRVGKTSQYYRDGFEQILDTINKAKGEGNE